MVLAGKHGKPGVFQQPWAIGDSMRLVQFTPEPGKGRKSIWTTWNNWVEGSFADKGRGEHKPNPPL